MEKSKIEIMAERDVVKFADWGIHITCPYCKGGYTHIESAEEHAGSEYECWQGRGGAARIAMFCEECPNLFYVRVGEHKGNSFLDIETSFVVAEFHKCSEK